MARRGSTEMSRRLGACPCAWRRKPLWARGRDRARAQLTRECDTPTMGAPRQGVNPATLCAAPSTGAAHTVFATAAKRPAPARGRCMPSPVGVSGAVHSRGATDRAPMLWSGPRPRPIAWRAHCGRAGHPPEVSGRPHWVRRPQPPPPTQASPWLPTADGRAVGTLWTTRGEDAAACGRGDWLRVWFAGTPLGACKPRSREAFIPSRGRRAMLRACLLLVLWRAVALALAWCGRAGVLHSLYLPVSLALL